MQRIGLVEYLLIAEPFAGIPAERLARMDRVVAQAESALAAPFAQFGDYIAYPTIEQKAAIYCSRLAGNHPLPDGNKRAAYATMRMFLGINGYEWSPAGDDMAVAKMIERVASREVSEPDLTTWVQERIREP